MEFANFSQRLFLALFVILNFLSGKGGAAAVNKHNWRPTKLFVFGDSYAATGNNNHDSANEVTWNYPYGKTFPGKPTGRYSDGRVLTDYIAKFIRVKTPISYKSRKVGGSYLQHGMNFAYANTGVTNISFFYPSLTAQIDYFHRIIKASVYNAADIQSSVALVTLSGDDYVDYIFSWEGQPQDPRHPKLGWTSFSTSVVDQLSTNLKRIYDLGVKKVLVTSLEPMGCLPISTAEFYYKKCNETRNSLSRSHNLLLRQAVDKLSKQTKTSSFIILDLYSSFMSAFKNKGSIRFKRRLRPCCTGVTPGYPYGCGSVIDIPGEDTYTLCKNISDAFFWDEAHPTQRGWSAVYSYLHSTLDQLY